MEHLRQLRERVSALQDAHCVSQKDLLRFQGDVLALRSERSAVQTGVDVLSMDHVQDDLLALCSVLAGNVQNDLVILVDTDGLSTNTETTNRRDPHDALARELVDDELNGIAEAFDHAHRETLTCWQEQGHQGQDRHSQAFENTSRTRRSPRRLLAGTKKKVLASATADVVEHLYEFILRSNGVLGVGQDRWDAFPLRRLAGAGTVQLLSALRTSGSAWLVFTTLLRSFVSVSPLADSVWITTCRPWVVRPTCRP